MGDGLKDLFSPRGVMQRAKVDTTGMDPEMKETLGSMRGAVGAGGPDSAKQVVHAGGDHEGLMGIWKHVMGMFKGGK